MTLETILRCSRPVLFENTDETYQYSVGGTCFVVTFNEKRYVITAKHVLKHFSPKQFCVQYHPACRHFLSLRECYCLKDLTTNDTDKYDLAIFSVNDISAYDHLYEDHPPYSLSLLDKFVLQSDRSKYAYRGYPIEIRSIDWLVQHIRNRAFVNEGVYGGRAPMDACHEIKLPFITGLDSIDGISGSPIFQVDKAGKDYSGSLAGMFLRGFVESKRGFFLDRTVIVSSLANIQAGNFSDMDVTAL